MRTCPYCLSNIFHSDRKREDSAEDSLREFLDESDDLPIEPPDSDESVYFFHSDFDSDVAGDYEDYFQPFGEAHYNERMGH